MTADAAVTVVIPSYNRADLLAATVESVLAQTVRPLEVIVVDDGSTDATPELCATFRAPVRCIRQENQGLPAARNTGIRAARGEWVALVDSDDLWPAHKLEVQLAAARATGAGWSATGFGLIDPDGTRIAAEHLGFESTFPVFEETGRSAEEHLGRWLERREVVVAGRRVPVFAGDAYGLLFEGNVVLPSTALVSRDVFARAGVFDANFRWAEETEFFHRAAAAAPVAIVMDRLADYRIGHASMISKGDRSPFIRFAIKSLLQAERLRPDKSPRELAAYRDGLRKLRLRLAYSRITHLDGAGARAVLRDARRDGDFPPQGAALWALSLLPPAALRGLHAAKRRLRGGAG